MILGSVFDFSSHSTNADRLHFVRGLQPMPRVTVIEHFPAGISLSISGLHQLNNGHQFELKFQAILWLPQTAETNQWFVPLQKTRLRLLLVGAVWLLKAVWLFNAVWKHSLDRPDVGFAGNRSSQWKVSGNLRLTSEWLKIRAEWPGVIPQNQIDGTSESQPELMDENPVICRVFYTTTLNISLNQFSHFDFWRLRRNTMNHQLDRPVVFLSSLSLLVRQNLGNCEKSGEILIETADIK